MRDGRVDLEEIDIRDASFLVETSRKICRILTDTEEFEQNFAKRNPNIPRAFFSNGKSLTLYDKAQVFAMHSINKSKALAKSVNQSVKRNNTFKTFGFPVSKVVDRLKTRKLVELIAVGEVGNDGRQKKKRITYNSDMQDHQDFMVKFSALYPGDSF